jgi:hypothetical protein
MTYIDNAGPHRYPDEQAALTDAQARNHRESMRLRWDLSGGDGSGCGRSRGSDSAGLVFAGWPRIFATCITR